MPLARLIPLLLLFLLTQLPVTHASANWKALSRVDGGQKISVETVYEALISKKAKSQNLLLSYGKSRGLSSLKENMLQKISRVEDHCYSIPELTQDCRFEASLLRKQLARLESYMSLQSKAADTLAKRLYLSTAIYTDHLLSESLKRNFESSYPMCSTEHTPQCQRASETVQKVIVAVTDLEKYSLAELDGDQDTLNELRRKIHDPEYLDLD